MIEKQNEKRRFQIYYNTNIAKSFAQNLRWRQNLYIPRYNITRQVL